MIFVCCVALLLATKSPVIAIPDDIHYARGDAAMRSEKWADAISELEESAKTGPHSTTAYMLAVAYSRLPDPEKTAQWSELALALAPGLPRSYRSDVVKLLAWARAQASVDWERVHLAQSTHSGTKDVDLQQAELEYLVSSPYALRSEKELEDLYFAERDATLRAFGATCATLSNEASIEQRLRCIVTADQRRDVNAPSCRLAQKDRSPTTLRK